MKIQSCPQRVAALMTDCCQQGRRVVLTIANKVRYYLEEADIFFQNSSAHPLDCLLNAEDRAKAKELRGFRIIRCYERDGRGKKVCRYQTYDLIFTKNSWIQQAPSDRYRNLRMQYIGTEEDFPIIYRQNQM